MTPLSSDTLKGWSLAEGSGDGAQPLRREVCYAKGFFMQQGIREEPGV